MKAFRHGTKTSFLKPWPMLVVWDHNRRNCFYICFYRNYLRIRPINSSISRKNILMWAVHQCVGVADFRTQGTYYRMACLKKDGFTVFPRLPCYEKPWRSWFEPIWRLYVLCNSKAVADEFHYLFVCSDETITQSRLENLDKYYVDRPDNYKFKQ
jgi:hypothetical protein